MENVTVESEERSRHQSRGRYRFLDQLAQLIAMVQKYSPVHVLNVTSDEMKTFFIKKQVYINEKVLMCVSVFRKVGMVFLVLAQNISRSPSE